MKFHLFMAVLVICLLPASYFSQNSEQNISENTTVSKEEFNSFIKEILFESSQLRSDENKIFVATLLIDLLWEKNENISRQLASKNATVLNSKLSPKKNASEMIRFFPYRYDSLRHNFIETLAKYDFAFAEEMKEKTKPKVLSAKLIDSSQQITFQYLKTKERDLEQKMAFQVASKDLKQAEKIAIESLNLGISPVVLNNLRRFQIREREVANRFVDKVIENLLKANFKNNLAANQTTSNLIIQMDEKVGTFKRNLKCDNPIICTTPLTINENKFRDLAAKWLDYALAMPDEKIGSNFLYLMPMLLKNLPGKKAEITQKSESIKKSQPKTAEYRRVREKTFDKKTSPSEIAKMGIDKSEEQRFTYYNSAFTKAASHSKEVLESLLLELSKHPDSEEKNWLIDRIYGNIACKIAEDGHLDEALEVGEKITKKDMRIGFLTYFARKYFEKENLAKAIILTDQITILLDLEHRDKLPKSVVNYDIFSNVFKLFALINPERGFLLLETALPYSNEYFAKRFGRSNVGEINLRDLVNNHSFGFTSYSKPIKRLAERDFDYTKKLIRYFEKFEISVLAKLLLLQAISEKEFVFRNYADTKEMVYPSH